MKKILFIISLLTAISAEAQETLSRYNDTGTLQQQYIAWCYSDSVVVGRRYYITDKLYKDIYFIPSHPGYKKINHLPRRWKRYEEIKEPREFPTFAEYKKWIKNLKQTNDSSTAKGSN